MENILAGLAVLAMASCGPLMLLHDQISDWTNNRCYNKSNGRHNFKKNGCKWCGKRAD